MAMISENIDFSGKTVIHIGSGLCQELAIYRASNANSIILIDANETVANELKNSCAEFNNVDIMRCAVSGKTGRGILNVFNLSDVSSLRTPSYLNELFPGLTLKEQVKVKVRDVSNLVAQITQSECEYVLVVDTPGEEYSIINSLIESKNIYQFSDIFIQGSEKALFEDSATLNEVAALFDGGAFSIEPIDTYDPDMPALRARFDFKKYELAIIKPKIENLENQLESLRLDLLKNNELLDFEKSEREALAKTNVSDKAQSAKERNALKSEIENIKSHSKTLESEKTLALEQVDKLKIECDQLQFQLKDTLKTAEIEHSKNKDLTDKLDLAQQKRLDDIANLNVKLDQVNQEYEAKEAILNHELTDQVKALQAEQKTSAEQVIAVQERNLKIKNLETAVLQRDEKLGKLDHDIANLNAKLDQAKKGYDEKEHMLLESEQKSIRLESKLVDLISDCENLKKFNTEAKQAMTELNRKFETTQKKKKIAENNLSHLRQQFKKLKMEYNNQLNDFASIHSELSAALLFLDEKKGDYE